MENPLNEPLTLSWVVLLFQLFGYTGNRRGLHETITNINNGCSTASCGSTEESKPVEKKPAQEKPAEQKMTLSETTANFTDVSVEIEKAYLKGDTLIIETLFTNDSYEGEIPFSTGAYIEVKQGDVMLEETSGVMEGNKGDYFFKNKKGIHTPVKFEYKLSNKDNVNIRLGAKRSEDEPVDITATIK